MNDMTSDTRLESLPPRVGGVSTAAFLANLLNPAAHNIQHFRLGSELCAGKRGCDWRAGELARCGHASLLHIRLARLASSDSESISSECNWKDANEAAKNGHVDVVRDQIG